MRFLIITALSLFSLSSSAQYNKAYRANDAQNWALQETKIIKNVMENMILKNRVDPKKVRLSESQLKELTTKNIQFFKDQKSFDQKREKTIQDLKQHRKERIKYYENILGSLQLKVLKASIEHYEQKNRKIPANKEKFEIWIGKERMRLNKAISATKKAKPLTQKQEKLFNDQSMKFLEKHASYVMKIREYRIYQFSHALKRANYYTAILNPTQQKISKSVVNTRTKKIKERLDQLTSQ